MTSSTADIDTTTDENPETGSGEGEGRRLLSEGRITPEGVQKMRDLMHVELRRPFILNTELNFDAVRRFCWGVGDDNPLWLDHEHAKASAYGMPVTPQDLLYTTHPTYVQVGLPGVHGLHAGTSWKLFAPVPVGTRPDVICWLDRIEERESQLAGPSVWVYFKTVYADQHGRVLAEATSYSIRSERARSRKRGKESAKREMKVWDADEIAAVEERILARSRRGSEDRRWEDVEVGDQLDELLKGPLCSTDMIAWYGGSVPVYQPAHELALRHYRRHPKWAFRNPVIGVLEPNIRVHENIDAARSSGLAGPYDVGIQRHQWAFQAMYDWAGDNSFLKACSGQFRGMNYFGDLTTFAGSVVAKRVDEDGDHVVDIEWAATNQRGETTMPGTATIALPSSARGNAVAGPASRVVTREDYLAANVPNLVRLPGVAT
jgi:hypothetical protein